MLANSYEDPASADHFSGAILNMAKTTWGITKSFNHIRALLKDVKRVVVLGSKGDPQLVAGVDDLLSQWSAHQKVRTMHARMVDAH